MMDMDLQNFGNEIRNLGFCLDGNGNPEGVWRGYAECLLKKRGMKKSSCSHNPVDYTRKPFVKISGLSDFDSALEAALAGANFLGFDFSKESHDAENTVLSVKKSLDENLGPENQFADFDGGPEDFDFGPKLVAEIDSLESPQTLGALDLIKKGVLDFIQVDGNLLAKKFLEDSDLKTVPHFFQIEVACPEDFTLLDFYKSRGENRVLVKLDHADFVYGKKIDGLWVGGKSVVENFGESVKIFSPELVDVSWKIISGDENFLLKLF